MHVLIFALVVTVFSLVFSVVVTYLVTAGTNPALFWPGVQIAVAIPLIVAPICAFMVGNAMRKVVLLHDRLEALALTDALTGLNNRRAFMAAAERESERSQRQGTPLAMLVVDLDFFKRINDTFGHAAGDSVLVAASEAMRNSVRQALDVIGRMGGEEFAMLLPGADPEQAWILAERVLENVARAEVSTEHGPVRVTASVGLAALGRNESYASAYRRADAALYEAKARGRNQVAVAPLAAPPVQEDSLQPRVKHLSAKTTSWAEKKIA
jgi:diguanylate cyclase (GGDEF)-like protein